MNPEKGIHTQELGELILTDETNEVQIKMKNWTDEQHYIKYSIYHKAYQNL